MISKVPIRIEPLNRLAFVDVYLPDDYHHSQERYPVMYMFDGQNLFYDDQASFGSSWKLRDYLEDASRKVIVVGLECDPAGDNRLHEYMPYACEQTFFGPTAGKGAILMEWIVQILKPTIDRSYRTWPQREATAIAGSSMGGLMAFYAVIHHNDVFSKAACLSPSLMACEDEISHEFDSRRLNPDTRIYWSFGSKELDPPRRMKAQMLLNEYCSSLAMRGGYGKAEIIVGGEHNESTWASQNARVFHFLWDPLDSEEPALLSK